MVQAIYGKASLSGVKYSFRSGVVIVARQRVALYARVSTKEGQGYWFFTFSK
jgi:hypothetical protein